MRQNVWPFSLIRLQKFFWELKYFLFATVSNAITMAIEILKKCMLYKLIMSLFKLQIRTSNHTKLKSVGQ